MILLFACVAPDAAVPSPDVHDAPFYVQSPREAVDLDPADGAVAFALTAGPITLDLGDGPREMWAYNGSIPGPTLRARVGDDVAVTFTNGLPVATTVHWHGMAPDPEHDGSMIVVEPGATTTYRFTADAGRTAWYHPHVNPDDQVDRGLYGFFVVDDPAQPRADAELLLAFDQLDEGDGIDDTGMVHGRRRGPPPPHDTAGHHGGTPTAEAAAWVVNGRVAPRLLLPAGAVVRARVLNASNAAYLDLRASASRWIAGDQGLFGAVAEGAPVLAPGDRVELEWAVGEAFALDAAPYTLDGGAAYGAAAAAATIEVAGAAPTPAPLDWPFDAALPSPDPAYTDLVYLLGGAPGAWTINGEAWPDVTPAVVPRGSRPIVELRNLSATRHPFHTHGNVFEVLSVDGVAPPHRRLEDTVDVGVREVVRVRLFADNPGDWMVHCHILGHEAGGMMTLLRVE